MKVKLGTKVRWQGDSMPPVLTKGKIYTVLSVDGNEYSVINDQGNDECYPKSHFDPVEILPGTKVRWIGKTEWLVLTHGKVYTILSVEKDWYRIIDDSGEDYLYPPHLFVVEE